ncbi:SIALI-17 repeat-containing surface protein [Streptococcus bouchesdurhonensis]|nr:SIALI-17 repeat-containing surface protein [Streptococcus bouchesdurhonensis]
MIQNPHLVHADEMVASLSDSTTVKEKEPNSEKVPNDVENHPQVENQVKESDKIFEHVSEDKSVEKTAENPVKIVDKTALNELIEKIRNTDLQTKTAKSVENLNLSLSRAQAVLDKAGASQDEIDKEVQALSDSFAQLEEKSNDIETKEKQADKANDSDEKKNLLTEKIAKVQALVSEINQLAGEISYEFSESENKSLQVFADLSEGKATESEVDGALNEAKSLRNKVANRVTREHSGKRDPRNGKPIDGKGESGFRAIWISSIANKYEGSNALVNENKKELTFYNSDTLFSVMTAYGKRGNGEPLVRYPNGPKRGEEDPTPYYVKRVGIISGLDQVNGLKLRVAYKNFQTGKKEEVDIAANYWNVNNPEVQMALVGTIGNGGNVTPGTYHITIGANGKNKQNTITYTLTIKPQSERNTVNNLTPTYVDDVRHLTETEKNALIEKFKAEHPNVVNRANHIDFDHAEVSADGATMTIHFKDGFNPKTIQTNATNDVEAKHSSLTAYFGDSKEIYTNPRELVRSKTGHEVPTTAQVTYKTPFNLQQAGTRNVVVTTTYENGVTKDVTTPYTVLDFLGKQDKKINQNQSGQLGDARNYVTVSDNSAVPGELTVRWKGGSSNVDTSAAGVQHKEIEILRGSHLMKTVNVPVEIVDNIKPTITAPDNITLTRLEGLPSEINIHAQDNDKGVGLKESNSVTVDNLPNPLSYNAKKSKIEINGVIPNNFQLGKSSIQVTVKAVDKKENTATKNITFHIQSQTQKYTAVANSQIQEVSYGEAPDAGTSIQKNGLPTGTRYGWATQPNTATGPGDQTEVVTVTYPDGSTDTVPVTVKVRKLSDEHIPTGKTITVNQNDPVTNDRLKAAVTVDNGGTRKVKSVTAAPISTVHAGSQTIKATVTYLDNTTDPVDIPLEVKDVIAPTIQTPTEGQTWEITALDKTLPPIKVAVADNPGGSGIKSIVPMNLPSFLKYDKATSSIVFQDGEREVPKLSGRTRTTRNITLRVEDNAGNSSERTFSITHMPMAEKYNPQANATIQEVSHGETPNPKTSVNTAGLPTDAQYTWKSAPDTNRPGNKTGVVKVTYPDDSVDEVTVTVKVRKLSDEYEPTATKIVKNQNDTVSEQDLKSAVTINKNGNSKVKTVTPVGKISTAETGNKEISATVTYLDDTRDTVTIPLEVKDVTAPTIQTPANGQNIDLIALDKAFSPIKVTSEDNAGGSGVRSTTVTDLPDFLTYDDANKTIKFKDGTQEVPKLPVGTDSQTHTATIRVTDNANNSSTSQLTFTVKSMTTKYDATANPNKQTVSYGATPDAGTSVNQTGLPEGTSYAWKTPPVTTDGPGEKDGVVEVKYKDGSKDIVNVKVTVKGLSSEYEVTGTLIEVNQNDSVSNDDLKAKVTATSKAGNVNGTDKISTVTAPTISTANYGEQTINATVTFKDGTTKEVTIPLKVKDVTPPTIQSPAENTNWEMTALDKALPNMEVRAEDNANGSGIKNVTVTGLPDYLEYDSANNTIKFKSGKEAVEKLPENTPSQEFTLNIRAEDNAGNFTERTAKITVSSMSAKTNPTPIPQNTSYGQVPDPNKSVDKAGLPDGTKVTWKTPPVVSTPGATTGEVEITYPDGSKDVVTVNVTVRKVSEDFTANGTQIEVNQNVSVTPEMLKGAVTATNAQGENGNTKIVTVEAKAPINTEAYGDQTIQAKVTYVDGSEQDVTIPLKVKDVTDPTIQTPAEHTNWGMTALDKTLPPMKIEAKDNANGSGVATIEVNNMPSFLTFDQASGTIVFKEGVREVPRIDSDNVMYGVTIVARDKAGNSTSILVNITVWSMRGKYSPTAIAQEVDNGHVPNPETSVNKTGLPEGTTVTWKTRPDVSTPGSHPGVALVHYPDGTEDEVEVPVRVKEQKETFNPTAKEPNQTVRHKEVPDPEKSINTNDLPAGTNYSWSEQPDTSKPGSKTGKVLITYPDKSTEEVTVTVNVTPQKDEYTPTGIPQEVDNGHVPNPETSVNKTGLPEGTTVTWKTRPDVSTPGSHPGVALVHYPDGTEDEVTVPITVKEQKDTFNPTAKEPNQTVRHNEVPDPEKSINTNDLPAGTNYSWSEQPDTSKPGSKTGKVLITYPDHSTEEVTVTVNVTPQNDEYSPTGIAQTVDNGHVPDPETSVNKTGLPEGTTVTWKTNPDVSTPGSHPGVALVHYPDGTVDEVTVPITVKEQKDTFNPTAKQPNQTAKHGSEPSAEGSINTDGLPSGTTYTWVDKPDTNTSPGNKTGKVLITYPDHSTEEVTVTVNVTPQNDEYTPTGIPQEVDNGHVPDPETSVNKTGLPEGTTVTWKTRPDVSTPGSHPGVALVHYPDGTEDEVEVPVTVKKQSDTFNPTAKEPNQTVRHKEVPDPEKSINTNDLPAGTNYSWSEQPDTSKPGSKTGKVLITYPDKSTEEVTVTVNVTPQKDEYTPTGIPQEVDNGHVPDPETSVNKTGLPEGTTVTWKTRPDVSTPGSHPGVALVHYPDGTEDEVEVPVTVKKQSDTFNPTAKEPNQTVRHNEVPDPEKSINTNDLPAGTNYSWSEQPDTSKSGSKPGKVLITYPDHSTEEVTVTVEVTPQKDDYDPQPKAQTVEHAQVPSAKDSIENVKTLPEGTTFGWKDGKIPDTSKHGEKKGVVTVTYPDGSTEDVDVVITVNPEDFSPVVPMEKVPVKDPDNLTQEEQDKVKENVKKANPGKDITVDSKSNVTITDPETKVSHEISRDKLVFAYAKGEPETSENPEFNGGVNAPDSPIHEVPEFAGGVNGEPETQEILPEFNGGANTPNSPTHEVPEFNGGVNGELPDPVEVSKIQLMITKWVDENGKELKPADAKAPKVLGEANEAFEHGEIKGYVFVRTETKGDVVTHIFRKVSPVRSTGDGQQGPATPSDDTNPRPDTVIPAEVPAAQPAEQPSQTVEVPTQLPNEVSETNPSVSQTQAVLPNTGIQEDRTTGAVGVLSLLGAFGLLFAKKKKDDEEEA